VREAIGVALDVTDADTVAVAAAEVERRLGPVDIVVNNAGWDDLRAFVETDESFWRRVVDINYLGTLRVTRQFLPGMIERGWGRVVSTSSDAARVGSSLEAVYAGAKAGVIGFTKSLAREVATAGVTANVVCPGPTETPLLGGMVGDDERGQKCSSPPSPADATTAIVVAVVASRRSGHGPGRYQGFHGRDLIRPLER
jgi:2-hydroxycyclohexanecarboxyl-CoA dehydrogenase